MVDGDKAVVFCVHRCSSACPVSVSLWLHILACVIGLVCVNVLLCVCVSLHEMGFHNNLGIYSNVDAQ